MPAARLDIQDLIVRFAAEPVLDIRRLDLHAGGYLALTGPSGSGKTTLLHVMAGILRPTSGTVVWNDTTLTSLSEAALDRWRRQNVGLIFQDFHLIEQLSPLHNVVLPATFSHFSVPAVLKERAGALLLELGVPNRDGSVSTLSRGERQRVAIARSLLFDPPILLADEPTASLDQEAAEHIAQTLTSVAASGRTVVVVSHDPLVVGRAARAIRLERGRVVSDSAAAIAGQVIKEALT